MVPWLLENTIAALLLGALALLAGAALRARPAVRHALWLAVLLKLVTPPVLSWTVLAPRAQRQVATSWQQHVQPAVDGVTVAFGLASVPAVPAAAPEPAAAARARAFPWAAVLAALWMAGALVLLARAWRGRRTWRAWQRHAQPPPRWLAKAHRRLCRALRTDAALVVARGAFAPSIGGVRRPRVLWPASLTARRDRAWLVPVLAHELAHARRRDHWTAAFELGAAIVYWWHPLFWLARGRVREYAEQACDAWALQLCDVAPRAYADGLLRLRAARPLPLAAPSARGGGMHVFRRRLVRVMRGPGPGALPAPALLLAVALLVVALPSWGCVSSDARGEEPSAAARAQAPQRPAEPTRPRVVVEKQMGDLATLRLVDESAPRPKKGDVLEVRTHDGRTLVVEVTEIDEAFAFVRIRHDITLAGAAPGAVLPVTRHGELGGPLPRFQASGDRTLIADYADSRVVEIDADGEEIWRCDELYGAWDVEPLANGNLLLTEFAVSRVREIDRSGKTIWQFEELRNPYDADRLPNGNTLIADTFRGRVIEVDPGGEIVWEYAKEIRPFDVERLEGGNTLIADVLHDRVLEVDADGDLVWEASGLPAAHDVGRLPNGHTLVTLRTVNRVLEIDPNGSIVFALDGLTAPSDADRLPNGHTLVAEHNRVRVFDRAGKQVAKYPATWAVEANRY